MTLRILHWTGRIILATIFLYTGYIKIQEPLQFAVAISGYQLVPEQLVWPIARYFPWLEIALGVFLLIGWKIRYVAGASAALRLFFTVILSITYVRGIEANCGCFSFNDRISPKTIARDSIILIPALFLIFEPRRRPKPDTVPALQA
jgi:putative oxidoreductase